MLTVTKVFHFEAAHVLPGYSGNCSRLHGHSYKLVVTVSGLLQELGPYAGMIVDFSELKRIVQENIIDEFDHKFLLATLDSVETTVVTQPHEIAYLPIHRTTAEELVCFIFDVLRRALLKTQVRPLDLESVTLWETEDNSATWSKVK